MSHIHKDQIKRQRTSYPQELVEKVCKYASENPNISYKQIEEHVKQAYNIEVKQSTLATWISKNGLTLKRGRRNMPLEDSADDLLNPHSNSHMYYSNNNSPVNSSFPNNIHGPSPIIDVNNHGPYHVLFGNTIFPKYLFTYQPQRNRKRKSKNEELEVFILKFTYMSIKEGKFPTYTQIWNKARENFNLDRFDNSRVHRIIDKYWLTYKIKDLDSSKINNIQFLQYVVEKFPEFHPLLNALIANGNSNGVSSTINNSNNNNSHHLHQANNTYQQRSSLQSSGLLQEQGFNNAQPNNFQVQPTSFMPSLDNNNNNNNAQYHSHSQQQYLNSNNTGSSTSSNGSTKSPSASSYYHVNSSSNNHPHAYNDLYITNNQQQHPSLVNNNGHHSSSTSSSVSSVSSLVTSPSSIGSSSCNMNNIPKTSPSINNYISHSSVKDNNSIIPPQMQFQHQQQQYKSPINTSTPISPTTPLNPNSPLGTSNPITPLGSFSTPMSGAQLNPMNSMHQISPYQMSPMYNNNTNNNNNNNNLPPAPPFQSIQAGSYPPQQHHHQQQPLPPSQHSIYQAQTNIANSSMMNRQHYYS